MSIDSQMAEVARIEMLLAEEENKRAKWKTENIRRRHNYLPLIMELLRYSMKEFLGKVFILWKCFQILGKQGGVTANL